MAAVRSDSIINTTNIDQLKCPLTKQLFYDPVMASCGHIFEKGAIDKQKSLQCPHDNCKKNITSTDRIAPTYKKNILDAISLLSPELYKDRYLTESLIMDIISNHKEGARFIELVKAKKLNASAASIYTRFAANACGGDFIEVIKNCNKAIELDPAQPVYGYRALAHTQLGDYGSAEEDFLKVFQNPNQSEIDSLIAHRDYVDMLYKREYFYKMIATCNPMIKRNQNYADAYYYRGLANLHLKKYDEAIVDFDAATMLNQNLKSRIISAIKDINLKVACAAIYYMRATVKIKQSKFDEAIADFDLAIEFDEAHREIILDYIRSSNSMRSLISQYFENARSMSEKNELVRAAKYYDWVIKLDPLFSQAYYNRWVMHVRNKEFTQAIADLNKALDLDPLLKNKLIETQQANISNKNLFINEYYKP